MYECHDVHSRRRYLFSVYTPFAVRNGPEPVLRYPSIRAHFSTYFYANSGHLKIKLLPNGPYLSASPYTGLGGVSIKCRKNPQKGIVIKRNLLSFQSDDQAYWPLSKLIQSFFENFPNFYHCSLAFIFPFRTQFYPRYGKIHPLERETWGEGAKSPLGGLTTDINRN